MTPKPPELSTVPEEYHDLGQVFNKDLAVSFIALPKLPSAKQTADQLVNHVFRLHGIPVDIVSDRGPQFTSQICQCERADQDFESTLRCVTASNPTSWATHLPWIEYAHDSLTSSATGVSPFEASLGYQPPMFPVQEGDIAVPSVQLHLRSCRRIWRETRAALLRSAEGNKRIADCHRRAAPTYKPGQKVWLSSKNIPLKTESKKLSPRSSGPFVIDSIINPTAIKLRLPAAMRVHPVFHVSQLKPVSSSQLYI